MYLLVGNLYTATSRLSQVCDQVGGFLGNQTVTRQLYDAKDRDPVDQVTRAQMNLSYAAMDARDLTARLRAAQTDIAGLGVREIDLDA